MITVKGYTQLTYSNFQRFLHKAFVDSKKKEIEIASDLGLSSPNTIRNAFDVNQQRVSDKVLTGVMKSLGINGFVVCKDESKFYYISNKSK